MRERKKEKNESNFENHKGFSRRRRRGTMRNFAVFVVATVVIVSGPYIQKKKKSRFIIFGFSSLFLLFNCSALLIHASFYLSQNFFRGGLSVMKGLLTLLSIS